MTFETHCHTVRPEAIPIRSSEITVECFNNELERMETPPPHNSPFCT